jgi:cyclase
VNHKGLYDNFMVVYPELDPFEYAREAIPTDDPDGAALFPDRDAYYADLNKGTIVFTGDLWLRVGDHDFHLLHTPGHTPGQLAVYVPQERMVFTGDTIFSGCQTWLMTSDVDQWLDSLEIIRALEVDTLVPGHGPVTDLSYVDKQRSVLLGWKAAVADAVAAGWTKKETQARVKFPDLGPVDIGQEYMLEYVETLNVGSLFDKLTSRQAAPTMPRS